MGISKLEDLKVAYQRRQQEIKDDKSEVIHFLMDFIVDFRNHLDPESSGIHVGNITYGLIKKHLKRQKDDLSYDFNFPVSLREHCKPLQLTVVIECIRRCDSPSTFRFLTYKESFSLPPKDNDNLNERITVFDHIYESFKEQISKSCNL